MVTKGIMKKLWQFLVLALFLALPAWAGSDEDFVAAREAFRSGDGARLDALASRLTSHVLYPHVAFWQFRLRLADATEEEVAAFLSRYPDTLVAERLRVEWLKVLGAKAQWERLLDAYTSVSSKPDTELNCYLLDARLHLADESARWDAKQWWASDAELPDSCGPVLDFLAAEKVVGREEVWKRFRLLAEAGKIGAAKNTLGYLPDAEVPSVKTLDKAAANPPKYLKKPMLSLKTRAGRELALVALLRVAKSDLEQALPFWVKLSPHFNQDDRRYVWARLATLGARHHHPAALSWYELAGPLGTEQSAWKARAALRENRWGTVLATIEEMAPNDQMEPAWRYWKARALKVQGKNEEAQTVFDTLAREHHFYGQLAANELGGSIEVTGSAYKPLEEEIKAIEKLPGIQRALAFYRLDWRIEGNNEWLWAISRLDDEKLIAAAEFARRNGIYDRAIFTAGRTLQVHDFSLRYLAPYQEIVRPQAKSLGLDEAWVYGLIRQESRFISTARSSAGAMGLMQLMPATAKWVAKQMGVPFRNGEINGPDTNIAFGTFYLKHVSESLDEHPVLASAAYNAGPGRARRWRADEPLEGALYAETIPFFETRDYVKKVMSNASYYAALFGNPARTLKQRLGIVGARSRGEAIAESEQ
jgi:soluble lytic murein transglycosylase